VVVDDGNDIDPFSHHLPNLFLGTSTSGFLVSQFGGAAETGSRRRGLGVREEEDLWTCSVPGGMALLTYH